VEREIFTPVDIADADGRLRREALGWARHPIQRCNLSRGVSRLARWNYWCITSRTHSLTLLIADVGYFGGVLVSFLDFEARGPVERVYVRPGGLPVEMPDTPRGDVVIDVSRLRLAMRAHGEEMRVEGEARTLLGRRIVIDLTVGRPLSHETVNLIVPWDDTRFHFTSKQQALPARGVVRVGSREHRFEAGNQSFACLDFGCGRWPSWIEWNWAFASASTGAHTIGLNLGAKWTEGTGITENGVVIDGRVHKVADAVDFTYNRRDHMEPWRIRTRTGSRVDLRFDPIRERKIKVPLGIAIVELHQLMGVFSGTFIDDGGARVRLDDMVGLAESVRAGLVALR
jgi:hypothetical protein